MHFPAFYCGQNKYYLAFPRPRLYIPVFIGKDTFMPENMLKKMLFSLCSQGAQFHHPSLAKTGLLRGEDAAVSLSEDSSGFAVNIPGDRRFHPDPRGHQPYYPTERHPGHAEIVFPVHGVVDFQINGKWITLEESRTHILLPNTSHTERHFQELPYTLLWLTSLPSSLTLHRTEYSPDVGYRQSACRVVITPPTARSLWECGSQQNVDEPHYFSLLVQSLDYAVSMKPTEAGSVDYRNAVLTQIKQYLDENYRTPVSLNELAYMAHFSVIYLNSIFRRQYGISLYKYQTQLRMKEALRLLKEGLPPGETAKRTGFSDQRYFSRIFRRYYNVAPSQYLGH